MAEKPTTDALEILHRRHIVPEAGSSKEPQNRASERGDRARIGCVAEEGRTDAVPIGRRDRHDRLRYFRDSKMPTTRGILSLS